MAGRFAWARLPDKELLKLRFKDLKLTIEGTWLNRRLKDLQKELDERDIRVRPHVWLSDEWFSPDGTPGFAIPFYLAHPRLMELERKTIMEVEGGTLHECMRIMRHEMGHVVQNAFRLNRRRRWQQLFGPSSKHYPSYYKPNPASRNFVQHLRLWYAQSHPTEDFAETFAVWLQPDSDWRERYKGWPALRKLEYVDQLMHTLAGNPPRVASHEVIEPLSELRTTLREHYRRRRAHYGQVHPTFYDDALSRIFSDSTQHADNTRAATFLSRIRKEARRKVADWTGAYQYTIDQVLGGMIDRCRERNLRLAVPEDQARHDFILLLTVQTMNNMHSGRQRVAL